MIIKEYITPETAVLNVNSEGILCSSVGGNTGYGGDGIIGGGDLTDDNF
jgi:hypothetical protein